MDHAETASRRKKYAVEASMNPDEVVAIDAERSADVARTILVVESSSDGTSSVVAWRANPLDCRRRKIGSRYLAFWS